MLARARRRRDGSRRSGPAGAVHFGAGWPMLRLGRPWEPTACVARSASASGRGAQRRSRLCRGLTPRRASLAARMVLRVQVLESLRGDMGIDLCRRNVAVPQQHLHYPQVGAMIEKMRCERMS